MTRSIHAGPQIIHNRSEFKLQSQLARPVCVHSRSRSSSNSPVQVKRQDMSKTQAKARICRSSPQMPSLAMHNTILTIGCSSVGRSQ